MQGHSVINSNFFAGTYVAQGVELYVPVQDLHKAVWLARMIDVVRAVAPATPVQTPFPIYRTDPQQTATRSAFRFSRRYSLAGVVGYLFTARERSCRKAPPAVDARFINSQTGSEFEFHGLEIKTGPPAHRIAADGIVCWIASAKSYFRRKLRAIASV